MGFLRRNRTGVVDVRDLSTEGQRWGQPGRCPRCGSAGFLDRIDLVDREMYQHCPRCGEHWITSERDLRAAR